MEIQVKYQIDPESVDVSGLLERRKCGCYRAEMPDFVHWWKFSRVRYWGRCAGAWRTYLLIVWSWWWMEKFLGLMERFNSVHLVFGMVSHDEAQDRERWVHRIREANADSFKKKLWLGADSDHPDGIYATAGHYLVCMTNKESRHW